MRFDFRQQDDLFFHIDSGHCAGHIVPSRNGKGFSVHRALTNADERDKIGAVNSMDEALPLLTEYYVKNWPLWKRKRESQFDRNTGYTMFTAHVKWSFYGVFTVEQQDGRWVVSRCTDALLHGGKKATFETAEIARCVADLHEHDGFADYPALDDGYAWDGHPWIVPGAYQTNG
jgi:hypothetical protein